MFNKDVRWEPNAEMSCLQRLVCAQGGRTVILAVGPEADIHPGFMPSPSDIEAMIVGLAWARRGASVGDTVVTIQHAPVPLVLRC
jgi:hypothetical protein